MLQYLDQHTHLPLFQNEVGWAPDFFRGNPDAPGSRAACLWLRSFLPTAARHRAVCSHAHIRLPHFAAGLRPQLCTAQASPLQDDTAGPGAAGQASHKHSEAGILAFLLLAPVLTCCYLLRLLLFAGAFTLWRCLCYLLVSLLGSPCQWVLMPLHFDTVFAIC
jgi:hypothetical protein